MGRIVLGAAKILRPFYYRRTSFLACLAFAAAMLLIPGEPARAAFKKEAANSCVDCHKTLSDKRLTRPLALWLESVHAEVGNTCDGCHGGDPNDATENSMSKENRFYAAPAEEDIVTFCGKCHQELSEHFMASAHGTTGTQTCIDCHGSHTIRRISVNIIHPDKCSGCHDYENPGKLKNILESLHEKFHQAESKIKRIRGFPTDPLKKDLEKIWNKLRQVRMISHTFEVPLIEAEAETVMATLARTDLKINQSLELAASRKRWGYVTVMIFIGLALLTYFYNKRNQNLD